MKYFVSCTFVISPSKIIFNVNKVFQLSYGYMNAVVKGQKRDNASVLVTNEPIWAYAIFQRSKIAHNRTGGKSINENSGEKEKWFTKEAMFYTEQEV